MSIASNIRWLNRHRDAQGRGLDDYFETRLLVADDCWLWTGVLALERCGDVRDWPLMNVTRDGRKWRLDPALYAWFKSGRELDDAHYLVPACGNHTCVRPEHQHARAWAADGPDDDRA